MILGERNLGVVEIFFLDMNLSRGGWMLFIFLNVIIKKKKKLGCVKCFGVIRYIFGKFLVLIVFLDCWDKVYLIMIYEVR